jgi:hypothetical protein
VFIFGYLFCRISVVNSVVYYGVHGISLVLDFSLVRLRGFFPGAFASEPCNLSWFGIAAYIAVYREKFELILNQNHSISMTLVVYHKRFELILNMLVSALPNLRSIWLHLHLAIEPWLQIEKKQNIDSFCCVRIGNELILNKGWPCLPLRLLSRCVLAQRPAP